MGTDFLLGLPGTSEIFAFHASSAIIDPKGIVYLAARDLDEEDGNVEDLKLVGGIDDIVFEILLLRSWYRLRFVVQSTKTTSPHLTTRRKTTTMTSTDFSGLSKLYWQNWSQKSRHSRLVLRSPFRAALARIRTVLRTRRDTRACQGGVLHSSYFVPINCLRSLTNGTRKVQERAVDERNERKARFSQIISCYFYYNV